MDNNDYFFDSVPDGISNAIHEYDAEIECCNQDSYELLVMTFGKGVSGDSLRNATELEYEKFGKNMALCLELEQEPTKEDARMILAKALKQWEG